MKSKSNKYSSKKPSKKSVKSKVERAFRAVTLQDKDEQPPKQKAVVCPCCANDCKCCVHPSGTVGHRCTCRCHS